MSNALLRKNKSKPMLVYKNCTAVQCKQCNKIYICLSNESSIAIFLPWRDLFSGGECIF